MVALDRMVFGYQKAACRDVWVHKPSAGLLM
jgi:hypothetical protein